jgi:hypothetical protein
MPAAISPAAISSWTVDIRVGEEGVQELQNGAALNFWYGLKANGRPYGRPF